jgi:hypothetical protein
VARKRKVVYPVKRTPPKAAAVPPGDAPVVRTSVVAIDVTARRGRAGLSVGQRVRILGTGLYAGEVAVIEKIGGSVVPAATVRTEAGRSRQVRTIDLEPVTAERVAVED